MATKVKPCRIKATGTPQVGYVPKYVDEDTFQWGAGGGGGGSEIEYVTQAEYNALLPGALTDGKHYFIYSTDGGGGWQPGANTLVYLPMESDILDHSGKAVSITNTNVTIDTTQANIGVGYFNGNGYLAIPTAQNTLGNVFTICWYGKISAMPSYSCIFSTENSPYGGLTVQYEWTGLFAGTATNNWDLIGTYPFDNGTGWANWILVRDVTNWYLYKNGTLAWTGTSGSGNIVQSGTNSFIGRNGGSGGARNITGYISNFIIENKARTAQEVADYYDLTKGDYGIS